MYINYPKRYYDIEEFEIIYPVGIYIWTREVVGFYVTVIRVVIGVLVCVSQRIGSYFEMTGITAQLQVIQKAALLGTERILRMTLSL